MSETSLTERGSDQVATGARSDAPVVGETPAATRSVSDAQPVLEVARAIADGHPFTDQDAVRVARAFLEEQA